MRGFSADAWQALSFEERIRQCRTMAAEAQTLSRRSEPKLRRGFEQLAAQWNQLADEMEAESARRNRSQS